MARQISQNNFPPAIARAMNSYTDLPNAFHSLVEENEVLRSKRKDLEREGFKVAGTRRRLTNQARNWVRDAQHVEAKFISMNHNFNMYMNTQPVTLSGYQLRDKVDDLAKHVKDLIKRGVFDRVITSSPPSSPQRESELPTPLAHIQSTFEQTFEEIWDHLHKEGKGIICVYGMGGIGKTTLMREINNKLEGTHLFHIVIWITVSKDFNLERIQKQILNRLGLIIHDHDDNEMRCSQIYRSLKSTRYLLILDDLWKELNLDQVGIPKPNRENGSKIAITTRLVDLCNDMVADVKIRVKALKEEEAWNLFLKNAGEVILLRDIRPLAEKVLMECSGLPLAITTVGRAMGEKTTKELWENALRTLKASVPEIRGMEPKVFRPLKLSYDHLEDDIKRCFLYCSLFPEDFEIDTGELIEYWIMEGFIDNVDNLTDAVNKGYDIVERIMDACLFEEGNSFGVTMHDLIRDLALWITSPSSSTSNSSCQNPKFIVRAGLGLKELPLEGKWGETERISLMRNKIAHFQFDPTCRNLVSLLMRENPISVVDGSFFEYMPTLEILDLSYTHVELLPISLSSLKHLRALILKGCEKLIEVPFLGQLKQLQFLDLSKSGIKRLPQEMGNLVKLKKLNLSYMKQLRTIPRNVLSGVLSLEYFQMIDTEVVWAKENDPEAVTAASLGDFTNLTHLTTLMISFELTDISVDDVFVRQWSTLRKFHIIIGANAFGLDLPYTKQVEIYGGRNYPYGVKAMLSLVLYQSFEQHFSQLGGDSKSLRMLILDDCGKMECVIDWREVRSDALRNIDCLQLNSLPKLKRLFKGQMTHECLRELRQINICACHKLKSLFSFEMVEHLDQLEDLCVTNCVEIEEIIEGDEPLPDNSLPRLHSLQLHDLWNLRSIINGPTVTLPSLKSFFIQRCPKLMTSTSSAATPPLASHSLTHDGVAL